GYVAPAPGCAFSGTSARIISCRQSFSGDKDRWTWSLFVQSNNFFAYRAITSATPPTRTSRILQRAEDRHTANDRKRPVKASLQGRVEARRGPGERQPATAVRATDLVRGASGRVVARGPAPCHLWGPHAPDAGRPPPRRLCLTE